MPNSDDYLALRRMTGETDQENYTDTDLDIFIQRAGGDLTAAAAAIWREKAASYADLTDITEAGSTRKNSDLYKNATAEAERLEAKATVGVVDLSTSSTTRRIVRL